MGVDLREVAVAYLNPWEVLAACRLAAAGRPPGELSRRCWASRRARSGCGIDFATTRRGVAWATPGTGRGGLLEWAGLWRLVTAGATAGLVEALAGADRAYTDHEGTFMPCPGRWGSTGAWNEAFGAAWYARSGQLGRARAAAAAAVVRAEAPAGEQLDLLALVGAS